MIRDLDMIRNNRDQIFFRSALILLAVKKMRNIRTYNEEK